MKHLENMGEFIRPSKSKLPCYLLNQTQTSNVDLSCKQTNSTKITAQIFIKPRFIRGLNVCRPCRKVKLAAFLRFVPLNTNRQYLLENVETFKLVYVGKVLIILVRFELYDFSTL